MVSANGYSSNRQFSVFKEFSKKIKGEAERYSESFHNLSPCVYEDFKIGWLLILVLCITVLLAFGLLLMKL